MQKIAKGKKYLKEKEIESQHKEFVKKNDD